MRIDTDRLGLDQGLTILFDSGQADAILHTKEGAVRLSHVDLKSIWFRKPMIAEFGKHLPISREAGLFMRDEWAATLKGLYRILCEQDTFWVSDPDRIIIGSYKPFQLWLAQQIGWEIPQTTVTSSSKVAAQFWQGFGGKIKV